MAGRLGNQLFSWAFSHRFIASGEKVVLMSQNENSELSELLYGCNHIEVRKISPSISFKLRVFFKISNKFKTMKPLISKVCKVSSEPELFNIYNSQDYCGFFQRHEYVMEDQEIIFRELMESLGRINLPINFLEWQNGENYQCLHIRRGDYLLPENSGYGLLDLEWYLSNQKSDLRIVIVTDDKPGASKLLSTYKECLILGPTDANVFQALSIMSKSTHLVAANSTLSWWGGFLVAMQGHTVVYPTSETEKHRDINLPIFDLHPGIYD
jgi:hypothetical protein